MRTTLEESSFSYTATDEGMRLFLATVSMDELRIVLEHVKSAGSTMRRHVAWQAIKLDKWHLVEFDRTARKTEKAPPTSEIPWHLLDAEEEPTPDSQKSQKSTWVGLPALDPVTLRAMSSL